MDISWEDAQTFLAVAEARSMSGAARALGLGQPTISRRIAGLEERLGCQLFRRGKRGAEITEEGARLVPAAEQMARWAAEFDRLARGAEEAVSGVVRIAAPPALAVDFLGPFAARLRGRRPALRLEVLSSIEHVDLGRGTADLAVRTRAPHDPGLVSLARLEVPLGVFGARRYAERLGGRPTAMADLDWITWAFPFEHVPPRPMLERAIPGFTPAFASDDYLVQRSALVAGLGAMILERPLQGSDAFAGADALEEIDVGITLPPGELHLVCARSIRPVPRVRAVVEALLAELEARGAERTVATPGAPAPGDRRP
jgi:DNA-binding transcriptional LysR family regulator